MEPAFMRIALATVGTTGDVRPFVILGRALRAGGHDVRAVTWPVHVEAFTSAGIPAHAAGPHADEDRIAAVAEAAAARGPLEQVAVLRDFHLQGAVEQLAALRSLLGGHDLVLIHAIHALAHAAVLDLGARWASAVFDPVLLPTGEAPPPGIPPLGPANRLAWRMLDRMLAGTGRPLDAALEAAGSPRRGLPLFRARSSLLHLVACSPSIMRVPGDLPPTTRVTGAWLDRTSPEPLPAAVSAFLDAGAPPVVVTFGSMGSVAPAAIAGAVRRLVADGHRIVIQGPVPGLPSSDAVLAIGAVDHRALFPRASVVVHHGGAGTTHTAVAAGAPSVVIPQIGDQRYWAARLRTLGAAHAPLSHARLTGETLAAAVTTTVASPRFRAAAAALGERLAVEDGAGETVRLLAAAGPSAVDGRRV
jgi:sterol 3beta-glucosyltransferase